MNLQWGLINFSNSIKVDFDIIDKIEYHHKFLRSLIRKSISTLRFSAFDLNLIQFNTNDESQKKKEIDLIESVCEKAFCAHCYEFKGRGSHFCATTGGREEGMPRMAKSPSACNFQETEFFICMFMNETIKAAQDTLKHDYVWNKINEMIEHDVKGSPDEEFEIEEDDKVNVQSQLTFWLTFCNASMALEKFPISSISFTSCLWFLHTPRD